MGLTKKPSSSTYECTCRRTQPPLPPNPNPDRYEILRHNEKGNWLLVEIRYPDCTTYEGRKILLYYQTTFKKLKAQKSIDPHFSQGTMISPFARFEPTKGGWNAATRLMEYYTEKA